MPKLAPYINGREQVRMNIESLYWINKGIQKGKIIATFQEIPEPPTYHQINEVLKKFLISRNGIRFRIGFKETIEGKYEATFSPEFQIAFDFLNDKVKFFGIELMDYDDAGLFEDIHIEIYIVSPSSTLDYKNIK
jgi:hypothetical protein